MKQTVRLAKCAMMAAVCVVMMLLGSVFGLGMYAVPMFVGLFLIPIGEKYGTKYQLMLWLVVGALSLMIVPEMEQNLMFIGFFGWYPAAYSVLQRLPRALRCVVKLMVFNGSVIIIEMMVMFLIAPETMAVGWLIGLLVLANIIFVMYDMLIPKMGRLLKRISSIL